MTRPVLTLAVMLTLLAAPLMAQNIAFGGMKADTKAPVEVSADNLQVNQTTGKAVFSGNVVIGQGEMRLGADQVSVEYAGTDRKRIAHLTAAGNVTLVSGTDAAEAQNAVYDVESSKITLTGDVILAQGENVLSGERLELDLATGTANVAGRVRTILQPGSQ